MSDNAIIGCVMGSFGVLTWLLGLSYFLGRNTAKLDSLTDRQGKIDDTLGKIFEEIKSLRNVLPHACDKTERIARLEARLDAALHHFFRRNDDRQSMQEDPDVK